MTRKIDAFGGDGAHGVRFRDGAQGITEWVTRDLWFDRDLDGKWIVWSQKPPDTEDRNDQPGNDLGSIIVTDPAVVTFLALLGELLVDPARFSNELRFDTRLAQARSRNS